MKPTKPLLVERMRQLRAHRDKARQNAYQNRPQRPPNLRVTSGSQACSGCQHFAQRRCGLYGYSVRPYHVCDSFTAKQQGVVIHVSTNQESPPNPPGG